jgi:hypothetical protein
MVNARPPAMANDARPPPIGFFHIGVSPSQDKRMAPR